LWQLLLVQAACASLCAQNRADANMNTAHHDKAKRVFVKKKGFKQGKVLVIQPGCDFLSLKQKISQKFDFVVTDIYLLSKENEVHMPML
jgi:hypothetical protein